MSDITQLISAIEHGDAAASSQLLPLVYDELRRLAAAKLAHEQSGHTLQATALVHEAYLRLIDVAQLPSWSGRGHFFAAAAEAMRRILVESARRKKRLKRGGDMKLVPLDDLPVQCDVPLDDILSLDEALTQLARVEPDKAELVQLRFFAGLSQEQIADIRGVSLATVKRHWRYARAWLRRELDKGKSPQDDAC